jgi:aldose 1-epimerase
MRIFRAGIIVALATAGLMMGCSRPTEKTMSNEPVAFGTTPDGKAVMLYTLRNAAGMEAKITNYGGIIVSLTAPDRNGKYDDIVLGYDSLAGYIKVTPYFGALIGRYGNRIGKGQFTLDGKAYQLTVNDGANHLHGGKTGFDKVVWDAKEVTTADGPGLVLTYVSKDGEEGYPGTLTATVTYTLKASNELVIEYAATTDKPTIVNLTAHSYFNLAGARSGKSILDHLMMIDADRYTPVDNGLITTGELKDVTGGPMDFRTPTAIGARIGADDPQLHLGPGGYDHNWVLNSAGKSFAVNARVTEATTGRVLEVLSDQPGVQFYSGNFLDGTIIGKGGVKYEFRHGFCLEPQHFPDSPNKPAWPTVRLDPGQKYTAKIAYRFTVK